MPQLNLVDELTEQLNFLMPYFRLDHLEIKVCPVPASEIEGADGLVNW